MTCYFRHLETVFKKAGIPVSTRNKADVDRIIHDVLGVDYKNCPETWKQVRKRIAEDEDGFVAELRNAWNYRKTIS
jgi:hypothetical protein